MKVSLQDEIVQFVKEKSVGVSSTELAARFLKIKSPNHSFAHLAVHKILCNDRRCVFGEDFLWHPTIYANNISAKELTSLPWAAVYAIVSDKAAVSTVYHISVWKVIPTIQPALTVWVSDPEQLPYEEQLLLRSPVDNPFDANKLNATIQTLSSVLKNHIPVFLSSKQQAAVQRCLNYSGENLPDDTMLLSFLFAAASVRQPKPICLDSCYKVLFGASADSISGYAYKYGETLALCVANLLERLSIAGICSREDLDKKGKDLVAADFSSKAFTYEELLRLEESSGVYGFKDKNGLFIYIGKANNLKRRILGYFRPSDESPKKLQTLREMAHSLITSKTGSELESLLIEHRLIKKYQPILNKQTELHERKGSYKSVADCIVLLPHVVETKGMSVWLRRKQRIRMRSFDLNFNEAERIELLKEIEDFFYTKQLSPLPTDFAEMEIVLRWLNCHRDEIVLIPAYASGSASELYEAIKSYWSEVVTLGKKNLL